MIKIAITGAPCSGKSEFVGFMKQKHPGILALPEIASIIKATGMAFGTEIERIGFQTAIYQLQSSLENAIATNIPNEASYKFMLCDRGTVDAISYYPQHYFDAYHKATILDEAYSYDGVVFFLLPGTEELYNEHRSNNPHREEGYEASLELEKSLLSLWELHQNLHIVPFGESSEAKYRAAEEAVFSIVDNAGAIRQQL